MADSSLQVRAHDSDDGPLRPPEQGRSRAGPASSRSTALHDAHASAISGAQQTGKAKKQPEGSRNQPSKTNNPSSQAKQTPKDHKSSSDNKESSHNEDKKSSAKSADSKTSPKSTDWRTLPILVLKTKYPGHYSSMMASATTQFGSGE